MDGRVLKGLSFILCVALIPWLHAMDAAVKVALESPGPSPLSSAASSAPSTPDSHSPTLERRLDSNESRLLAAVQSGEVFRVREVLKDTGLGPEVFNAEGKSALAIALEGEKTEVALLLMEQGAFLEFCKEI